MCGLPRRFGGRLPSCTVQFHSEGSISEQRRRGVTREIAAIALGIAASPFPIIPAILLLFTPRPRMTAGSFLLGWVLGIVVATTTFAAVASLIEPRDATPAWVAWTRVSFGSLLILVGVRQWATRREKASAPAWMQALSDATPARALRLGLLLSAANPKVLLLTAAGGLEIESSGHSGAEAAVAIALFAAVAASTVSIPLALYAVTGERMLGPLSRAKDWLALNNAAVMAVVITVIGIYLAVKGLR
jgi:threonine/homoserine/homoserine lactone efflux protein